MVVATIKYDTLSSTSLLSLPVVAMSSQKAAQELRKANKAKRKLEIEKYGVELKPPFPVVDYAEVTAETTGVVLK